MLPSFTLLESSELFDAQARKIRGCEQEWDRAQTDTVHEINQDNNDQNDDCVMVRFHAGQAPFACILIIRMMNIQNPLRIQQIENVLVLSSHESIV